MHHDIHVTMISRDALLLERENHPEGHYPIWYYDPKLYPKIEVGDSLTFSNNGETYAHGTVTETNVQRSKEVKVCSAINSHAFKWKRNQESVASG